jgi:hypothetical protein
MASPQRTKTYWDIAQTVPVSNVLRREVPSQRQSNLPRYPISLRSNAPGLRSVRIFTILLRLSVKSTLYGCSER